MEGRVVDFADDDGAEEEDDFEAFGVFDVHAVEVGFVDGDLFVVAEDGESDVGFAIFALAAVGVCGFFREQADVVFG